MNKAIQEQSTHTHTFKSANINNEKRTLNVIILTAVTMVVVVSAGIMTGSMALLADGWHMGTHFFSLGIAYCTYIIERRYTANKVFTFGPGKFGILSAYTSALMLGSSAIYMIYESILRFISPEEIAYNNALIIVTISLIVNVTSIIMLRGTGISHNHEHNPHEDSHHEHEDKHYGQDQNFRAAYMHIVADTLTSALAIIALFLGKFFGWSFLDPLMGIVGALLILRWSYGLIANCGLILLGGIKNKGIYDEISKIIESDGDSTISDLHIWALNEKALAGTITIISKKEHTPTEYRERLASIKQLMHVTIEIHYDNTNNHAKALA